MGRTYTLVVRRYAPFESFGGGFEGDNRGFSTSLQVTARTIGMVSFSPLGGGVQSTAGSTSGSTYIGPWAVRKTHPLGAVGKSVGQVRVMVTDVSTGDGRIAFTMQTSGNLPLKDVALHPAIAGAIDKANQWARPGSPNPQGAPNIDTYLDFKASVGAAVMVVEGVMRGDSFPNCEAFLLDGPHGGNAAALLDYRTNGGIAGPLRLVIPHPGKQRAFFTQSIPLGADGAFAVPSPPPTVVQEG